MIERIPFGSTGHTSSRAIFGAAALGAMNQARADKTIAKVVEAGLNHFDVAASYGDAELRYCQDRLDGLVFLRNRTRGSIVIYVCIAIDVEGANDALQTRQRCR